MVELRSNCRWYAKPERKYLEGEISSSLLGLQYLTYLDLSFNNFSRKPFPNYIGSLTILQYLNLSHTNIDRVIPQQFENLSRLISLDLSWNYDLTEAHNLDWLIHLSSLTHLDMGGVNLSQVINWPNKVMMLPSLTHLSLRASTSSQLLFLDLSFNYFTCSIFHWLFNSTTSLVDLHLCYINRLQCSIPDAFGSLNSLRTLNLARNQLVSGILRSFWKLCSLDSLYLFKNRLSGNLYKFMSNASGCVGSFREFQMWNNRITGPLPESIGNLSNLEILDAYNNSLTGAIYEAPFSNLIKLKTSSLGLNSLILRLSYNWVPPFQLDVIYLGSCRLGSTFQKWLQNLSANLFYGSIPHFSSNTYFCDLVILNLVNNNFYGKIPDSMGSLVSVQILHLSNNRFVEKILTSLQKCNELITIDLGANNLSEMIPLWIGNSLSNLAIFNLRSNQLNGSLPLSLCHLSYIQILDLSLNKIELTIPKFIYNLIVMSHTMDTMSSVIYANNRGGPYIDYASLIPKGITNLTELVSLNLSRNNLFGLITLKIGLLRNLQCLDLSRNQPYGEIPVSISNLSFLSQLDLSANNLSSKIATGTQIQSLDASPFLENLKLCGFPLPNKCIDDLHPSYVNPQGDKNQNIQENNDDRFITKGFYVAVSIGFMGGFWGGVFHISAKHT
ncbi:hypothetical protein I3760_09G166600, partial [Carya illinoinensis]